MTLQIFIAKRKKKGWHRERLLRVYTLRLPRPRASSLRAKTSGSSSESLSALGQGSLRAGRKRMVVFGCGYSRSSARHGCYDGRPRDEDALGCGV